MKLDKIISLANKTVRLRFLAMERSLRATGCQLPILVIPYDDNLFELPKGSTWWAIPEIINWLTQENAHPMMRKYQCLTVTNYQFVDSDVCFLRNPEEVLQPHQGFITSCGHWRNATHTFTPESKQIFIQLTTNWQKNVFNAGQFACDTALFSVNELKSRAMQPDFVNTCIRFPFHDQPGLNLLVLASGIKVTNLTLPPYCMESTWAGDYPQEYEYYWQELERKPYLIHWAGISLYMSRPINSIFYNFLSSEEKTEWNQQVNLRARKENYLTSFGRRLKQVWQILIRA